MGIVTLQPVTPANLGDASIVMGNFQAIRAQVNGAIETANLANGAVANTDLVAAIQGFLRSADGIARRINRYVQGVTFSAGAAETSTIQLPHGLSFTPTVVLLSGVDAAGLTSVIPSIAGITSTVIQFWVRRHPNLTGGPYSVHILAIE